MSYEEDINEVIKNEKELPKKLEISVLRYFWQSNPLIGKKIDTIPRFLRKIEVFSNFTENDLRILAKYLHHRKFSAGEIIFKQGERGVGFYLIYNGFVDIVVEPSGFTDDDGNTVEAANHVVTLERFDNFGELALLRKSSVRNANAVSRQGCEVLGILKPDIEELIISHPLIAAKLLQSVSLIVANRLFSVTRKVQELKYKIANFEKVKDVK